MDLTSTTIIFSLCIAAIVCLALRFAFRLGIYRAYKVFLKDATIGTLTVNTTDPEKEVFSLNLDCALGELTTREYIVFKVENTSSQEKPVA